METLAHGVRLTPLEPRRDEDAVGLAWLYALHVRSSLRRRKLWQCEHMISGARDHTLHLISSGHRRALTNLESSLVRRIDAAELARAFGALMEVLCAEIGQMREPFAARLQQTLFLLG
jgi:hypothetical protein